MRRQTWREFRDAGLLWWLNRILHTFGWSIVLEVTDDGEVVGAYPARTEWLGFAPDVDTERLADFHAHIRQQGAPAGGVRAPRLLGDAGRVVPCETCGQPVHLPQPASFDRPRPEVVVQVAHVGRVVVTADPEGYAICSVEGRGQWVPVRYHDRRITFDFFEQELGRGFVTGAGFSWSG